MAEDIPDLPAIGSVLQAYRETLARLDEVAKERDAARAAGRELVAENAALRRENERLRDALLSVQSWAANHLHDIRILIAESAPGGVRERGNAAEVVQEPKTDSAQ